MIEYVCARCHYDGPPRKVKRGSTRTEAMMWMVFPFGLPYTFWRMATKMRQCRHCDSMDLFPVESAMGKRLLTEVELSAGGTIQRSAPPPPPVREPIKEGRIDLVYKSDAPHAPRDAAASDPDRW